MVVLSSCRRQSAPWTPGSWHAVHPETTEICLMLSGVQHLALGGRHVVQRAGEVSLVPAGMAHSSWAEDFGYEELVLQVAPFEVKAGVYSPARAAFDQVVADASPEALRGLLESLSVLAPQAVDPRIERVMDTVRGDLSSSWTQGELAEIAKISVAQLARLFRAEAGVSPARWVLEERVRRAAWMLRATDKSVTQIGMELGFLSPARLTEAFKRVKGLTPSEWRTTR